MNTIKIKAPKAPLKGKGFKREPFSFRANIHADAIRAAFWESLPPEHKTEACEGRRAKGYFSFGKYITPEALAVFNKAARAEAERLGMRDIAPEEKAERGAKIERLCAQPDPSRKAKIAEFRAALRAGSATLPAETVLAWLAGGCQHPAPDEIVAAKHNSGLSWAAFSEAIKAAQ